MSQGVFCPGPENLDEFNCQAATKVFISVHQFHKSVMVSVATGGGTGESVPMLIRTSWPAQQRRRMQLMIAWLTQSQKYKA